MKTKITVTAPETICIYSDNFIVDTLYFLNEIDTNFADGNPFTINLQPLRKITAAAAVLLFAKVTKAQCIARYTNSNLSEQSFPILPPLDPAMRKLYKSSGLFDALRPGGTAKLDRLWDDWENPFKTNTNPSQDMADIIGQMRKIMKAPPARLMGALQESYLNIDHHAYMHTEEDPIHPFIKGRWWQYMYQNPPARRYGVIIYDMGQGIPETFRPGTNAPDCWAIDLAMRSGHSRLNIDGRGKGFDTIKRPVDQNTHAEHLLILSNRGMVTYRKNHPPIRNEQSLSIGGTLLEWSFIETQP